MSILSFSQICGSGKNGARPSVAANNSAIGQDMLRNAFRINHLHKGEKVARLTGLEPATSGVTGRHSNQLSYNRATRLFASSWAVVARLTGLEPATSGVTGRHSNQLSYNRSLPAMKCSKA